MKAEHIDQVCEIESDSFSIPWTRRDFMKELDNAKMCIYFVAVEGDEVLGYAGMWHVINEGHITNVAVKRERRREGVGDALIEALIKAGSLKEMAGLTLEVRIFNGIAQKLYRKHGFKTEGVRRRYYADTGEDAIIMWKILG
ncbi:MAG: ribosomal protein S18-alanine N-acetyltransferase [Clostridiales bacterium]|nr:ribosomal protein S18-alanine N-acetyltransferase [Clostridiales bacterium]